MTETNAPELLAFESVWQWFMDANPSDVTSPEEYPDHALMTFDEFVMLFREVQDRIETRPALPDDVAGLVKQCFHIERDQHETCTACGDNSNFAALQKGFVEAQVKMCEMAERLSRLSPRAGDEQEVEFESAFTISRKRYEEKRAALTLSPSRDDVIEELRFVFDGPPGPTAGRFVEVETPDGHSVNAGEWHKRKDGLWELRVKMTQPRP